MILEIPLNSTPNRSLVTQLGDQKFLFETRYNDRSGVWTLDMSNNTTKEVLLQSVPLVLGCNLLEPYNFGIGALVVKDTSNRGREATADDLGDRVKVYWLSADETGY